MQEVVFAPQMYGDIYLQRLSEGLIIRVTQNKWENGTVFWLPAASVVSAPGSRPTVVRNPRYPAVQAGMKQRRGV